MINLSPEAGVARRYQGVFAGSPAEEMRSLIVSLVMLATVPDFVKKEEVRIIERTVKIVLQAAFLFSCRRNQRANF